MMLMVMMLGQVSVLAVRTTLKKSYSVTLSLLHLTPTLPRKKVTRGFSENLYPPNCNI